MAKVIVYKYDLLMEFKATEAATHWLRFHRQALSG